MSKTITETIQKHIETYDENPYEINNGLCIEFAEAIVNEHEDAQSISWKNMVPWLEYTTPAGRYFTGHQWVFVDGKHYDAEAPNGVARFYNLPFMQRKINVSEYDSAIEILKESHEQKQGDSNIQM